MAEPVAKLKGIYMDLKQRVINTWAVAKAGWATAERVWTTGEKVGHGRIGLIAVGLIVVTLALIFLISKFNFLPVWVLVAALMFILAMLVGVIEKIIVLTYKEITLPFTPIKLLISVFTIYIGTAVIFGFVYYFLDQASQGKAFCLSPTDPPLPTCLQVVKPECRYISLEESIHFSFVTLSTVGYGDITPKSRSARTSAASEMVFGLFLVSVFLAVVVSKSVELNGGASNKGGQGGDPK